MTSPARERPTASTLLSHVQALAPHVAARSDEIEAARTLPKDLVRALADTGLFRAVIPEAYGGLELHPARLFEALETLARADGSTGWCGMIGAATAVTSGWLPEPAAREVFATPDVIVGGVAAPLGHAERVEGGYRATGHWTWASGSQHSDWLVGGVVLMEGGAPRMQANGMPETRLLFFPARQVALHDTWFASGLCGTGSGDMAVKEVFVPESHGLSLMSGRPTVERPLFRFPVFGMLALGIPAVALGIARRAIDELVALASRKTLLAERRLLAARPAAQEAVADAEATLRAARAFVLETLHAAFDEATRQEVSVRTRAELRLSLTHATRSAARVVDRMYEAAGGTAVFRASPLQRCFRDIHTATQHAMVAPATMELLGSLLLGQPADTSRL
ncbi:hydrolase [Corallococcus sp. H22C18031201]|uniref:acyl-CoA dehydrogenase family protein n=1 Tax=Citreicoccus inhibens TaxID=2849499 RepID=UPI000E750602|nr:acyl-CoA dehydrogenase family protein [Citreicoccus inhibens]MBU8899037.1 acyl-CoA dehydrogenase family protein [Citreicoccus inhibens]RJS16541.1 hydrolase [Corallococcus sp. H22C18031201]